MTRRDGRNADQPRPVQVELGIQKNPEGSVLYRCGGTSILVAATTAEGVPDWKRGESTGWLTGEYMMHPRCARERQRGRRGVQDGRATEITRLIGRSLRSAVDLGKLGARTIIVDCDVLDADGGTRTASVTGGMVATAIALDSLRKRGLVAKGVIHTLVSAISVGLIDGIPVLDLDYFEDTKAVVDLNVVATEDGRIVELQGTAEGPPIARADLDAMVSLALSAMPALASAQREAIARAGVDLTKLLA
jgi:ribonuclease PH